MRGAVSGAGEVFGGEQGGHAEMLFEADDAVLGFEGACATLACENEESQRQDDPPDEEVVVCRPVADSGDDGEDEVEQQDGQDEEVEGRVPASVGFVTLCLGHLAGPFGGSRIRR